MLGIYRLILALMVVLSHMKDYRFDLWPDPGIIAVVTFFVISGYLMPATFEANYRDHSFAVQIRRYLVNRALRVFPMYWACLALTVWCLTLLPAWRDAYEFSQRAIVQNALLLGLNQSEFWRSDTRFIGAAWTLDIELQFYLIVPVLVWAWRRYDWNWSIGLATATLASFILLSMPTGIVGWDRSLLPWLGFFLIGFTVYSLRDRVTAHVRHLAWISCAVGMIGVALSMSQRPIVAQWVLAAAFIGLAAMIVVQPQKSSSLDAVLGDLSFPVFLVHPVIIQTGIPAKLATLTFGESLVSHAIVSMALSVLAGWILHLTISRPLEEIRRRNKTSRLVPINQAKPELG